MGRDRTQLLACALIAISLVIVGTLAIDWFSTEGGAMKIDLVRARVCTAAHCTALPRAAMGSYGSAALATLVLSLGVTALVAFQTAARVLLDHAIPRISQLGSVLAVLAIGSVFVTAFVVAPDDELADAIGLTRSGAPMLAFAGLCVSIAALAMAIAPVSDTAALYRPVVIPKARVVVPRPESEPPAPVVTRTPARRIPLITETPQKPLSVVTRPPARVVATTPPPLAVVPAPQTARIPVMADAVDMSRRLEQGPGGTGNVPVVAPPRAVGTTPQPPIAGRPASPTGSAHVVVRPASGPMPVLARPASGPVPLVARASNGTGAPPAPPTARIPVLADAVDAARTPPPPLAAPTPARVKSGPLPVLPPHLRGKLHYVVVHAELTLGGIDARREDGSSVIVLWRDVVGAVVRRMPAAFDGITFVDVVSTAGATVRLVPWTRIRGAACDGDGDARARTLLEIVAGHCPEARLDPATQRFSDGVTGAAQLPDLATLHAHDARLA